MLPASLRPLRRRNFSLIWSAALVSNVGSWMQTLAIAVLVTAETHQALWTGLIAAAGFVPSGLLSPLGGVWADRVDRRYWLLATTVGETLFAGALVPLALTGSLTPWVAVAMVLGGQSCAALGFPAYSAMLPDLVGEEDLLAAVSLSSAQFNLGRIIGPALGGVALLAGSYALAFGANAVSFVAVMAALLLVRLPRRSPRPVDSPRSVRRELAEALVVVRRDPGCRAAVGLIAVVALLASPFIALVPAVALLHFHRGAGGASVLVTAQGVGAVAGAVLLVPVARRIGRRSEVLAALVLLPLVLAAYYLAPTLGLAAVGLVVVGGVYMAVLSGLNTTVQLRAPREARARVLGLYMVALGTLYPIGALVQGALADAIGIRVTAIGAAALLFGVLTYLVRRRGPALALLGMSREDTRVAASGGADAAGLGDPAGDCEAQGPGSEAAVFLEDLGGASVELSSLEPEEEGPVPASDLGSADVRRSAFEAKDAGAVLAADLGSADLERSALEPEEEVPVLLQDLHQAEPSRCAERPLDQPGGAEPDEERRDREAELVDGVGVGEGGQ